MLADARFVFFDLDDTLLDHRSAERAALADLHRHYHPHLGHHALEHVRRTYHTVNSALWTDFGAGRVSSPDLKRLRSARLLEALGVEALDADAFSEAYLARYATHWAWMAGAREAFCAVAAHRPVGLLTNGFAEQQRSKLARFPELARLATVVVVSDEVGVAKPSRAVFDHARAEAARATGWTLAPADLMLVGDSLASDVQGAVAAGWHAVWLGGEQAAAPEGVVCHPSCDGLADLLSCGPTAGG